MGGKRKNSGGCCKNDESGAKKSDDCDSQEELDCSDASALKWNATNNGVRYANHTDAHLNTLKSRFSARVMEKQEKLRRESSPAKQIVPDSAGQSGISVNTSPPGPGWKSVKSADDTYHGSSEHGHNFSSSSGFSSVHSSALTGSSGIGVSEEKQRKKRNWELWSQDDKQLFFEALNDFGKDFDAIQNHLANKLRPKNKLGHCSTSVPVAANQFIPKNKDQVRHFYYRTWNKISKFLTFPKEMKKAFQELYGLVNYGELRKKQRVLNMKTAAKLSELVEKGTTAIKVRGKTFRIKTPVCRALKRLNRLDDVEHARVPCKVSLELNAKDGRAWAAVQAVSHNPRVKVHVPLQRTLASVISYFEERWKSSSDRLKEQLLHTFGRRAVPRLRFIPTEKRDMNLPIFKITEVTSSAKLSLRSFTEKVLKETDKTTDLPSKNKKKQISNPDDSVTEAESDLEPSEAVTPTISSSLKNTNKSTTLESSETLIAGVDSVPDKGLSPDRQKQNSGEIISITHENPTTSSKPNLVSDSCCCPSAKGEEDFLSHTWDEQTIRRGWTVDDAGTLTCGELYLLLGQNDKLCFEYYWDSGEENSMQNNEGIKLIDRLVEVARLLKKRKTLTRSASKSPWPVPCTKCGHKPDLNASNLRTPQTPHPPINAHTQVNPHPSSTSDHTVRFQSEEFQVPQSIYYDAHETKPQSTQRTFVESGAETRLRMPQESFISTRNSEDNTSADTNPQTFRCPQRPLIPKETTAPVIMPPKPFLDLPKGNRRIGRPTLKRVVPRVLPLRPKTPDVGGMYTISIPGPSALRPVTHSSSASPNLSGSQIPVQLKSVEGQQINLLNCLKAPSTNPSGKGFVADESRKPDRGISVDCNEFEDLLKVRQGDKLSTDPENTFSLSSFMDISITGSSSLAAAASVCLNSDKFLNETAEQSSSCGLSLSNFLDSCPPQKVENQSTLSTPVKTLETPSFTPPRASSESGGPSLPDGAWLNSVNTNDPNDLSLSRILGTLDAGMESNNAILPTSDVNFQSVVGEGSLNFLTKFSERATKLSSSAQPDESS